jgi:hypothetical protein
MNQSYPHRMRLREPWHRQSTPEGTHCRRRFGYPGRIDDFERVWLVFDGLVGSATISLNGQVLGQYDGQGRSFEFDVTSLLQPRNELSLVIEDASSHEQLWDEVAIEVRCLAWLRDVQVRLADDCGVCLDVNGFVAGTSVGPLELYVVLDRTPLLYTTVDASPAGESFALRSEPLSEDAIAKSPIPVRVELVNGAVPWYTLDLEVNRE